MQRFPSPLCQPAKIPIMKLAAIFSALALILTLSCERSNCDPENEARALHGKWKYIQYYMDIGSGPSSWQPAPDNETFIQFNANGSMASDVGSLGSFTRYELKNDSTLMLTGPSANTVTMPFKKQ
jgi:hypothetical protein